MVYMDTVVSAWNPPIRANYEFVCCANYGVRPTSESRCDWSKPKL